MKAALIERMTAARAAREPACLVVDLVRGADRVVTVETLAADPLGGEIARRFGPARAAPSRSTAPAGSSTSSCRSALVIIGAVH